MENTVARTKAKKSVRFDLAEIVLNSSIITPSEKLVWHALYTAGPMTSFELDAYVKTRGGRLRAANLESRGMLSRSRLGSPAGQIWQVTMKGPAPLPKRNRTISRHPTKGDIVKFVSDVKILVIAANTRGARVSKSVKRVLNWLEEIRPLDLKNLDKSSTSK